MGKKLVGIDNLHKELKAELDRYTKTLSGKADEASLKVVKTLVKDIKAGAPVRKKNGGSYKKGWTYKKEGHIYKVHNRTDYQLTHLLEKGHAKIGGGRVPGRAHIRPAEIKAIKTFEEAVRKAAQES